MCIRLPDSMSYEVGAACSCSAATALHAIRRLGIVGGETLVIYGVGNIGFATLLLAQSMGCRTIVIQESGFRLELAKQLGAWQTIDESIEDPVGGVLSLTHGEGADATFDAGASPDTWNKCVRITRARGRCAVVGEHAKSGLVDTDTVIRRQLEVHGTWSASRSQVAELVEYVSAVEVPLQQMISHRFGPDRALEALPTYQTLTTGKVELVWPDRIGATEDDGAQNGNS
jgi:propanol-preferring alcohol dehydrogenase